MPASAPAAHGWLPALPRHIACPLPCWRPRAGHDKVADMHRSTLRSVAFFMLFILMANTAALVFNTSRLSHELGHAGTLAQAVGHEHVHEDDLTAAPASGEDETPNAAEHHILHAADNLQFFPDPWLGFNFPSLAAGAVSQHFVERTLPHSSFDPPFRPPCPHSLPA